MPPKAALEDEITLYNVVIPPCSQDRCRTGALEPICEIGSVQAEKKEWWHCMCSAKTPLSSLERLKAWLAWRLNPMESEVSGP